MKLRCALGAFLLLLAAGPAMAASYPGEEVTVNPAALGNGYLLYPGGKYGRHVGPLRQPGERRGPVHLHMPVKHVATRSKPRAPAAEITIPSETGAVAPPPPRKVARAAPPPPVAPTPAPAAPVSGDPNVMPEDSAARLFATGSSTPARTPVKPPPRTASAPPPRAPVKPPAPTGDAAMPFTFGGTTPPPPALPGAKPTRTASAAPPPARTLPAPATEAGLRKQAVIPFTEGSGSPAAADVNAIHSLAMTLNAALNAGAARVQLEAYGGPRGDKTSDSRRLSLKRALVVRELLIEDGVPSEKIDVKAKGGVDDSGAADRVDVFVRS